MLPPIELTPAQTRQYIDAEATLRALRDTQKAALEVRGSMFWREIGPQRYLIRVASQGSQTSLGPHTVELQDVYTRFMERKAAVEQRMGSLKATLAQHQRSNRALRIGRAPRVLIDTLNRLAQAGLAHHFVVVGTHALYAYESACGVRVQDDATATQDIDLLLDTRKYLSFVTTMDRLDTSLLSVFQKVDKTFQLRDDQLYTAVNAQGFEIDVVRHAAKDGDPHPLRVSKHEEDFWAVQISTGSSLLDGGHFEQAVVAISGHMAQMRVPSPASFIRVKQQLASMRSRDPLKARKDALQAEIVSQLVTEYALGEVRHI
jgi:hypothetical protein